MKSLYVNELRQMPIGQSFEDMFLIKNVQPKCNDTGFSYLLFDMVDKSGQISVIWLKKTEEHIAKAASQPYAIVKGVIDDYNGGKSFKVQQIHSWTEQPESALDYLFLVGLPLETLRDRLASHISSIHHTGLREFLRGILIGGSLSGNFEIAPAAQKRHHAFRHGLLQHTIEVTDIAASIVDSQASWGYAPLSRDLVVAGALLHDIGKVYELQFNDDCVYNYTKRGRFFGHTMIGIQFVSDKIKSFNDEHAGSVGVRGDCKDGLLHIIASHHGLLEYGALAVPQIPEAFIVHMADNLSAKLYNFDEEIEKSVGTEFVKSWNLDNKYIYAKRIDIAEQNAGYTADPIRTEIDQPVKAEPPASHLPILRFHTTSDTASDNTTFHTRRLPLVGRAAAGVPRFAEEHIEKHYEVEDNSLRTGDYYLLEIEGESMTGDGIQNGDMVIVHKQTSHEPDEIAVVFFDDREEAAIKRIRQTQANMELISSNPDFPPLSVSDPATLRVCGRVVGILRN
jgi:3'-5' exoribonuclease